MRLSTHTLPRLLVLAVLLWLLVGVVKGAPVSHVDARAYLARYEGVRYTPYRDGSGWSVGLGHSLTQHGERVKARYTAAEIDRFFYADLSWALDSCAAGVRDFDELPADVQLVALSVAFGVGRTGFTRFRSFREALSRRDYTRAALELTQSRWYGQVGQDRARAACATLLQR